MMQNKDITDTKIQNIDKSMYRVFNTFKRLKNSLYKEDFEAMQSIKNYIEQLESNNLDRSPVLLKSICYLMFVFTEKYGNAKEGAYYMGKELEYPLSVIMTKLKGSINSNDLLSFYSSLGYEELEDVPLDKQKELFNKFEKSFTDDQVYKALVRTTNNLIFNNIANEF